MADYMEINKNTEYGLNYEDRINIIQNEISNGNSSNFPIKVGNTIDIVGQHMTVPINILKYRINNNRTNMLQNSWCTKNGKKLIRDKQGVVVSNWIKKDSDHESDEIQQLQHTFLSKICKEAEGGIIYRKFLKESQTEPLILDKDGFVLSGNRRLCTWRNLYYNGKRPEFETVQVVFATFRDDQLDDFEFEEDDKLRIDLKYDWMSQAEWYKRKLNQGKTVKWIAQRTDKKESDIKNRINAYDAAYNFQSDVNILTDGKVTVDEEMLAGMEFACKAWHAYREEIGSHNPLMKKVLRAIIIPLMLRETSNTYKLINNIKSIGPTEFLTHMYHENNVKEPNALIEIVKNPSNWDEVTRQMVTKEKLSSASKRRGNRIAKGFDLINTAKTAIINANKFFSMKQPHQQKNKIRDEFQQLKNEIDLLEKNLKDKNQIKL